ncbi:MAG TPA: hypothetical protein PKG95_04085 [Anaerolineaceae bacterium]|nr:hypothetical protein [Anaerolineaceae bacterium]
MAVNREERLKILQMLQEGKISAEQATQLLEALEGARVPLPPVPPVPPLPPEPPLAPRVSGAGRWLRVRVTDSDTNKVRVNLRLPLSVVESGLKMGMRFTPEIQDIDPQELMGILNSGQIGQVVDVYDEKDGEHVEVFIE